MRLSQNRTFQKLFFRPGVFGTLALVFAQLSCGQKVNPAADIAISVSPQKALVVPGTGVSCVSRAAAKADGSVPAADVDGERVTFSNFSMQWRSSDKLTVASIRATIFSSGIAGADTAEGLTVEIAEDEVEALLGLAGLTVPFASPYVVGRVANISSNDTAKDGLGPYASCGLQIGGLAPSKGVKTYTARIKIEIVGFATACALQDNGTCLDGEQRPVRQSTTVSAQRF